MLPISYYIFIFLASTFTFIYFLFISSDLISSLGTYHPKLKGRLFDYKKQGNREPLLYKTFVSFYIMMILSLPLFLVVYIYFNIIYDFFSVYSVFFLALLFTEFLLLSIRLLSNPTETIAFKQLKEMYDKEDVYIIAQKHKERVLSFSFTLLFVTFILIYLQIITSLTRSMYLFEFITINLHQNFIFDTVGLLIIYPFSLFLLSLIGEIILWSLNPIIQEE